MTPRTRLLLGVAVVLAAVVFWRMFRPDGTITVDFRDAPLSKVVAAIERQGRVDIVTNADPAMPVTLRLRKAPLMEALDTLSVRTETDLRPALFGAPSASGFAGILEAFGSGKPAEGWAVAWFPTMGMLSSGGTPPDARLLEVKLDDPSTGDLQTRLREVSAKSGLLTAVPQDWNPTGAATASARSASKLAGELVKSSGGATKEVFLLIARPPREGGMAGGPPPEGREGWAGRGGGPSGDRQNINPAWLAARADAVIATLPREAQEAARKEADSLRAIWEEIRALPPEQRGEKMAELFSRPDVQERMAEREAARDAKRTPEQRAERYKRYIDRKQQATGGRQ